jgi:hypothetical protein
MRPILPGDLDVAVRVLLLLPGGDREPAMDAMLVAAEQADRARIATGRRQRGGGDGSLMSEALLRPRGAASFLGPLYRECLAVVLDRLARFEIDILRCGAALPSYIAGTEDGTAVDLRN